MSDKLTDIFLFIAIIISLFTVSLFSDRDLYHFLKTKYSERYLEKEKKDILGTIELYNKILSDFYASDGNAFLLNKFPGSIRLRHQIFRNIGFLQNADRILVYDLVEILPVDIKIIPPDRAEAIVLERWNYIYQRRNREIVSPLKGMGRGFKYYLLWVVDHWIVQEYEPVDVEEPEIKEFRF